MTITVQLNAQQTQAVLRANRKARGAIVAAAQPKSITARQFVFFAAFDGTSNTLDNSPPSNIQTTNVAQLWAQYKDRGDARLGGGYYSGPGAPGSLSESSWLAAQTTAQVNAAAQEAFRKFTEQASEWLLSPANARGAVAVALTAFSRGGASAALFSQMLQQSGFVHPGTGKKRQVRIAAGVLFDPVTTGVSGNLAFARNVKNTVVIRAANEYRALFRFTDYSIQQNAIKTVDMYGNHCDVGGGYDNALAALTLEAATGFLRRSGLPIGAVPASRRFDAGKPLLVHDEGFEGQNPVWTEDYSNNSLPPVSYFSLKTSGPGTRVKDDTVLVDPAALPA